MLRRAIVYVLADNLRRPCRTCVAHVTNRPLWTWRSRCVDVEFRILGECSYGSSDFGLKGDAHSTIKDPEAKGTGQTALREM